MVLLPVQEPVGDLVLAGVGDDGHQALQLLSRALACMNVTEIMMQACQLPFKWIRSQCPEQINHETPFPTGTLPHVNLSLLAADVGKAATDTLDGGQGIHDLLLAINVSVQQTQNVLELHANEEGTHLGCKACKKLGSDTHGTDGALASTSEAVLSDRTQGAIKWAARARPWPPLNTMELPHAPNDI